MTPEHFREALVWLLKLHDSLGGPKWALRLRFYLAWAWAASAALKNSDVCALTYGGIFVEQYPRIIGPDASFPAHLLGGKGKVLKLGQLHNAAAVRPLLPEDCPIGALPDLVVQTFGTPGKLTEDNQRERFILHAPNSPCIIEMAETTVAAHIRGLLRAVGMQG
ncbi:hypothetical protein WJX72_005806 [[Myrmecia] bisecta]|uniref:Uncharacterized protein n=1 Tax=[Myrmecia] bisecta TaxID=41462 RepID=A0AAW1PEL0_9CHLO